VSLPHLKVLVAEDHPINQKLASRILEKNGLDVIIVDNGLIALDRLKDEEFDMVLMDISMPEMDGLETSRTIRDPSSSVKDHDIPIIAMTAHALEGDREKCLDAGMNGYISKPLKAADLIAEIGRVWRSR
jgi:CheY-like chemotaxis protein